MEGTGGMTKKPLCDPVSFCLLTNHDGGDAVRRVERTLPPAVLRPALQHKVFDRLRKTQSAETHKLFSLTF